MRVAVVVRGGLHPSGREQVVPALVGLLGRLARWHEVHAFAVAHLREATTYVLNGVAVHDLGRPDAPLGLRLHAQSRALGRALDEQGPFDLVHGFWGDPAGVLAVRTGRRLGVPSLVTCDSGEFVALPDIEYGTSRSWRGRRRVREIGRDATAVHVCTQFMADLASRHGLHPCVIPIGTRAPEHSPRPPEGPPWRLLQVASLSAVKNQALLIDALPMLAATHDVRVELAGADTLGGALQHRAATLGVADRVTFHGFVPSDQLAALHGRAHLYVQTSRHEAAGVSVLEAAAAGVPVTGTRVGYLADWPANHAATIDGASPAALAEAIRALLEAPGKRDEQAARARAWTAAHDAAWSAARFDELYRSLGGNSGRSRVRANDTAAGAASTRSGDKPDHGAGRAPA